MTLAGNNEAVMVIDYWDRYAKRRWAWCYSLAPVQYFAFRVIVEGLPSNDEVLLVEDSQGHRALIHECEINKVSKKE